MRKLRVALVGCGLISRNHLRAYLAHDDRAEVVAFCDTDFDRAAALASDVDGARATTAFQEVLDDPGIDSIDLLTPHRLHREQTEAALAAGKHVLLQKPLAHTREDSEAIVASGAKAGTVLYYGEMNRTLPSALRCREEIEAGLIGRLVATQATYAHWQGGEYLTTPWRYDPAMAGGGQLLDGGIHVVAVMETAVGPIESVSAMVARFRPELGGEDTATLTFRYANGALGTFVSTHASALWYPGPMFTAFGTEGILTIGGPFDALTLHRRNERTPILTGRTDVFTEMVGRFLDTVLEGAPNPSTAEWGLRQFDVVQAAYRAAETGRTVAVPD